MNLTKQFTIITALTLYSIGMVYVTQQSFHCPVCKECPVLVVEPATVAPPVSDDPPDPPPTPLVIVDAPTWVSVPPTELKQLEGKWIDAKGLPLPTFEFVVGREGSRTPFNVRFQTDKLQGGCGVDLELRAWCKVHDDAANKKVPRAERLTAAFALSGPRLRVQLGQTATLDLVRAP